MMSIGCSLQFSNTLTNLTNHTRTSQSKHLKVKERAHLPRAISSHAVQQDCWCLHVSDRIYRPLHHVPSRYGHFTCRSLSMPCSINEIPVLKATTLALVRSYNALRGYPLLLKLVPSIGLIAFTIWGLGPLLCHSRSFLMNKNDANWKKSSTHYVFTSYLQPLLLWTGAVLVCRALDPVVLPTEASQVVKQRLLNFVRSLSTVLAFAYCISSLIQQTQKILMETTETSDARNMGFQFVSKAIYTAVWVAAISLFVELLGFSTQKWLTAGGLGTVLLTLAGREIFTNFLSSVMIHATRPFVLNEWIQTKIEGYEVSGTVEHVGWWSPTIIRGDDREAVHIPNHKFTVNVVRNLSQKTHWRVKTHFAISHLDANKISNIVADMRKVLAKNPQVEQQRLHRRVFLDYINPENQAFMILVSCFVKTSHFEEYLCVKEGILLDLLRVVSHHRARLATPIRTVQKIYNDMDLENVPFAETIITRAGAPLNRPLYLIESAPRINGDDKVKPRPTSRANEEPTLKNSTASEQNVASPISEGEDKKHQKVSTSADSPLTSDGPVQNDLEDKPQHKKTKSPSLSNSPTKTQLEGLESTGTTPNDLGEAHEKPPAKSPKSGSLENKPQHKKTKSPSLSNSPTKTQLEGLESTGTNPSDLGEAHEKPSANSPNSGTQQADTVLQATKHAKQETAAPPVTRPSLEDNIVLGMALDGSKRTLPIEEGMIGSSPTTETKELAGLRNGNGSPAANNNKGTAGSTESGGPSIDQQDQGK